MFVIVYFKTLKENVQILANKTFQHLLLVAEFQVLHLNVCEYPRIIIWVLILFCVKDH